MTSLQNQILDLIENNKLSLETDVLVSEIDEWRSTISETCNNGIYTIIVPFAKREILWPEKNFGKLDSLCFFSSIELTMWMAHIFSPRVDVMWDVGSHYGIDSLVMAAVHPNSQIIGFEPDPMAFSEFKSSVQLNNLSNVKPNNVALGLKNSTCNFTRVLGNTTASHIDGSRDHHGPTESFEVNISDYQAYKKPGFAKINIEGYERVLVPGLSPSLLRTTDFCIEIHSREDTLAIWDTACNHGINIYSQRNGYRLIDNLKDMPCSNKEGYVLLSPRKCDFALEIKDLYLKELLLPITR